MINKLLLLKNKPQAIIVKQCPLSNFNYFIKQYMKSIICEHNICNKCIWCKKIDNEKYYDLIMFDAKISLKKEDVINMHEKFIKGGLEKNGNKFFVVKNIEYANKQVLNSLLKFIEAPPSNVYIVFSTWNYSLILPTITSRCMSFTLLKNDEEVNDILSKIDLNQVDKEIMTKCFIDLDNLKRSIDNFTQFNQLINELLKENCSKIIFEIYQNFKNYSYNDIHLFLEIVRHKVSQEKGLKIINLQKMLYLNLNKSLIFNNLITILEKK